ncbi:MAG: class I SAM-dependent methyltransferase, partial [Chloroflexi bacterium]|nr:class I SAM-dependent methyltransferase [Chloroflexota bacterium]
SVTDVVPPQHAQLYKRGLLAAESRSAQTLTAWESHAESERDTSDLSLLEIGCGTAPLLVTAVSQYRQVVGIDIAFRWLVAAKKRLEDAGIDAPLICTCAEALPFPDGAFDRVAAESVIETVKDQTQTFAECYRVMRPGGRLFVATPNKFSLGPDPHTGLLAGGYLPKSWTAAYVRKQGG